MLLSILSSHKKSEDSSTSVYRFDAALRAVEAEFVAQAIRPILSGIKDITKVHIHRKICEFNHYRPKNYTRLIRN